MSDRWDEFAASLAGKTWKDVFGDQKLGVGPARPFDDAEWRRQYLGDPGVTVEIGADGARAAKPRHRVKAGRRVVP